VPRVQCGKTAEEGEQRMEQEKAVPLRVFWYPTSQANTIGILASEEALFLTEKRLDFCVVVT